MIYAAEEKSRMDYLLATFGDYIRSNKEFDIAFSEKLGYLSLVINTKHGIIEDVSPLKDFDALLEELFLQIGNDVLALKMSGYHDDIELFPEEMVELRRRVEPILNTMSQAREYCFAKLDYYLEHVNN